MIPKKLHLSAEILESGPEPRQFLCRFVRAGRVRAAGNQESNLSISPEALVEALAAGMFEARAVFVDHAEWFEHPSLHNLAGITQGPFWDGIERSVKGRIRFYRTAEPVAQLLEEMLSAGSAPDVGLSLVFWPEWEQVDDDGERIYRVCSIKHVESVDLVFEPAADGRVLQALSAASMNAPARFSSGQPIQTQKGDDIMTLTQTQTQPAAATTVGQVGSQSSAPGPAEDQVSGWTDALAESIAGAMISASSLPAATQERLRSRAYGTPEDVTAAIDAERQYLAALSESQVVNLGAHAPRGGNIQLGLTGMQRLSLAAEALFSGGRPERGVQPLTGIRELYTLLSGDYEMTGVYHPERVRLANVDSSTMAGLVANALNKRVVNLFQQYPRWWEPIVSAEDFSTLQQVKWITLGGVGELPTVAEGAAYTELTWDDQTETADFTKKGGYLGITLETIDKDDTRKVQAAPRALAQAAWLTLSKSVSNIFTANSGTGPTMSDSTALFAAGHANLGSTALSLTSYAAARTAMRKQTEVNSGERLGALTAPRYLLVPPDLEITALQVLASQHDYSYALANGSAAPENPFAQGNEHEARMNAARRRVLVIDLWTDSNNWAAAADPQLYPTIGLAFRYGRTPEIFSVASPTAGLMFTNDTMPVKVRFFFAVGPMDYRGLYKANVA